MIATRDLLTSGRCLFLLVHAIAQKEEQAVQHRHLNHQRLTLAAIDDVIRRGRWRDWAELRRAALADHTLLDKIERVCAHCATDPRAQRHRFWMHYVEKHRSAS